MHSWGVLVKVWICLSWLSGPQYLLWQGLTSCKHWLCEISSWKTSSPSDWHQPSAFSFSSVRFLGESGFTGNYWFNGERGRGGADSQVLSLNPFSQCSHSRTYEVLPKATQEVSMGARVYLEMQARKIRGWGKKGKNYCLYILTSSLFNSLNRSMKGLERWFSG